MRKPMSTLILRRIIMITVALGGLLLMLNSNGITPAFATPSEITAQRFKKSKPGLAGNR